MTDEIDGGGLGRGGGERIEVSSPVSGFAARLARLLGRVPEQVVGLDEEGPAEPIPEDLVGVAPRGTRYDVRREVGRGGMGSVLEVWDGDLRRRLAMKVLLNQGGAGGAQADERTLSRFLEEAQVTGQLDHPGVMPVHELGIDDEGRVFFTMRLVRGRELKEVFELVHGAESESEGWTRERALGSLLRVCEAMAYAHSKGVIHRDLKPANIMVGRFGETYVMDWGLAKVLGREDTRDLRPRVTKDTSLSIVRTDRREESDSGGSSRLLTMDGDVVGTPSYMAPEQARGQLEKMGPQADVYSVGSMLYHLLTGCVPFVPEGAHLSAHRILMCVMEGPPKPVRALASDAPPELLAICERAMAREVEARYEDMGAFAEDLRAYLEGRVVRAYQTGAVAELRKWIERNRLTAAAAAVAAVAVIGGLAWGWMAQKDRNATLHTARLAAEESVDSALRQSYAANLAAAQAALARNDTISARRLLAACPEVLRGWEWHHFQGQTDESMSSMQLGERVRVIAPGGRWVATWGEVEGIVLMQADGEAVHSWSWPDQEPDGLAVSGDGLLVAASSYSKELAVWDATGRRIWGRSESTSALVSLAFTPDGSRLLVQERDQVLVLGSRTGKELGQFRALRSPHLGLSADGTLIVVGQNGLALVRDMDTLEVVHQLGSSGRVLGDRSPAGAAALGIRPPMALSPDGLRLATAYGSGGLWIWSLETMTPERTFHGHQGAINCMAFSPDGVRLATGAEDQTLRVWDMESRSVGLVHRGHTGPVEGVVFRDNSEELLSVDTGGSLMSWHVDVEGERRDIPLTNTRGYRVAFHPDSRHLAVSDGSTAVVYMMDLLLEETTRNYIGPVGAVTNLAFSPDGARLATGAYTGKQIGAGLVGADAIIWNASTCVWDQRSSGVSLPYHGDSWSPDGRHIITVAAVGPDEEGPDRELIADSGGYLTRLVLRDASTGVPLREIGGAGHWVSAEFSPDGTRLACTSDEIGLDFSAGSGVGRRWYIVIFDVKTGSEIGRSDPLPGRGQLTWSTDGASLLVLDAEGLRRLSAVDGVLLLAFEETPFPATAFAQHPDGSRVAACGENNAVTLWETDRGRIIATLPLPHGKGKDIEFSPDGASLLVSTIKDLHLWGRAEPGTQHRLRREAREAWTVCEALVDELFADLGTPDRVLASLDSQATPPVRTKSPPSRVPSVEAAAPASPPSLQGADLTSEARAVARSMVLARSANYDDHESVLLARLRDPHRSTAERQQDFHWAWLAATQSPDGKNRQRVLAAAHLRVGDAQSALAGYRVYYAGRERLAFSALGTWRGAVFSATGGGRLRLRGAEDGALEELLDGHIGGIREGLVLTDGSLVTVASNQEVRRWDPATGESERLFNWKGRRSDSMDVAASGSRLVSGGSGGNAVVLDLATGAREALLEGGGSRIMALAISGDGSRVAMVQSSGQLRIWDVDAGTVLFEREIERLVVLGLALNQDGSRLVLLRRRQRQMLLVEGVEASLWDVDADTALNLELPQHWASAGGSSGAALFDGQGALILGARGVAFFDGATGTRHRDFDLDGADVQILAPGPARDHLLVGCGDRRVRRLDLPGGGVRFASTEPLNLSVAGIDDLAFYALALMESGHLLEAGEALASLQDRSKRSEKAMTRLQNAPALLAEVFQRAESLGLAPARSEEY